VRTDLKLLLTDNSPPLGAALVREFAREAFELQVPDAHQVDWCSPPAVDDYVDKVRPSLVVNTIGWSCGAGSALVDGQVEAAENLARACGRLGIPMIQLSSYQVFGEANKSKHSERDEPAPSSDAGAALYAAEQAVIELLEHSIVLRTGWVIASDGDNLLTHWLAALAAGEPWRPSQRLRGAPTVATDVARVVVALIKQIDCGADCWGVYHYGSGDTCTQVEFAEQVLQVLEKLEYSGAMPVIAAHDTVPQGQPLSAVLGSQRVRSDFGVQARTWRTSLVALVKQWLHWHQLD
jgi:dTDP-4-dehydrorhamnose reductase